MTSAASATFTLRVEGCPPFHGLSATEVDALVRTARKFKSDPAIDSGCRIEVKRETVDPQTRYSSTR